VAPAGPHDSEQGGDRLGPVAQARLLGTGWRRSRARAGLGRTGRAASPFIGAWARGAPGAHAQAAAAPDVADSARGRWASRGPGELEQTWVGPSSSAQLDRICVLFFSEFIFNAKTIPEKSRNCLKARKIF
jgi:hypothetical protein